MQLLILFLEFFKIGLFSVGGGLATLPFLYDLADKYPWLSASQIPDMIAISESTPGPLGVNMATYAGFHCAGPLGSVIATAGLVTPSVIVIIIVYKFLERFRKSTLVENAFYGLRPIVVGLICLRRRTRDRSFPVQQRSVERRRYPVGKHVPVARVDTVPCDSLCREKMEKSPSHCADFGRCVSGYCLPNGVRWKGIFAGGLLIRKQSALESLEKDFGLFSCNA